MAESDAVNTPSHYRPNGVDCFMDYKDVCGPEPFRGFLQLNVIKYVSRYALKGRPQEDLEKALFYLLHLYFENGGALDRVTTTVNHAFGHYKDSAK